jgi:hypothetical protein
MPLVDVTAKQVELIAGADYIAKVVLHGLESMFGTADAVKGKLEGIGFGGVVVQKTPFGDLPGERPAPDGSTFWARGRWMKAGVTKALPSQVTRVWRDEAGPPAAATPDMGPSAQSAAPSPNVPPPLPEGPSEETAGFTLDGKTLLLIALGLALLRSRD